MPLPTRAHRVTFAELWANYPKEAPCLDSKGVSPPGWENQCAVRVGVPLERAGVSFKSFAGGRCPTDPRSGGKVASAQLLATWLKSRPFLGCPPVEVVPVATWKIVLRSRTGIVFFKDYWRRHGETRGGGSGDHIDLWNKDALMPSWATFFRFTIGIDRISNLNPFSSADDNQNWYSDLGKSSAIWFWPIP